MRSRFPPLLALLATLLPSAALPAASARPAVEPHAVVFMYHRFGDDRYPSTNIRIEQFEAHLEHIEDNGYRVWPLHRIVRALEEGRSIPDRTVAITVDDAYDTVYEEAFPRLKERGWPFTVFVATDPVDRGLGGYMTWDQMREMQEAGARFANHSASHGHLIERRAGEDEAAWAQRVRADLEKAQRRLQAKLGAETNTDPALLAYPFGEYNRALAAIARELGFVGLGQQSGAMGRHSDLRALPRYPMAEAFGAPEEFAEKAATLPLPVAAVEPWDPVVDDNPPRLEVTLAEFGGNPGRLACYARGERLEVEWLEPGRRFAVRADEPLTPPRGRYNCTAPAADDRYYWYSHLWITPRDGPR